MAIIKRDNDYYEQYTGGTIDRIIKWFCKF